MSFDPREGHIGGPAWLKHVLEQRQVFLHYEEEQVRLANRRRDNAEAGVREARCALRASIPNGAGQEAAEYVPWELLRYHPTDAKPRWALAGGAHIPTALVEAIDLARVLGYPVTLLANGREYTVRSTDTPKSIEAHYAAVQAT